MKPRSNCARKGHVPHDGWKPSPMQNDAGQLFMHNICRNCHVVYIEFVTDVHVSQLVGMGGEKLVVDTVAEPQPC